MDVRGGLPAGFEWRFWKASLFEDEPYTDNFRDFQRLRGKPIAPFDMPARLPGLPAGIEPGDLPSVEAVRERLAQTDKATLHPEVLGFTLNYHTWISQRWVLLCILCMQWYLLAFKSPC